MKKSSYIFATAMFVVYIIISCNDKSVNTKTKVAKTDSSQLIKRGGYLVTAIGCGDCHSPKKMGPNGPELIEELSLSGYPSDRPLNSISTDAFGKGWMTFNGDLTCAAGPWGVSFSANITSDSTGIGTWTLTQFIKALREGKSKGIDGNRPLLPPMPWENFKNLSDDDLQAIFLYLKTTKPVHNVVPQPIPPVKDL